MSREERVAAVIQGLASALPGATEWDACCTAQTPVSTALEQHLAANKSFLGMTARAADNPRRLGFIRYLAGATANPSDPIRTDLINRYFVFPKASSIPAVPEPIVNASPEALDEAVNYWTRCARALADGYRPGQLPAQESHDLSRLSVLVGDRGVGKTFLQNYVISRYSGYFDANKVLWVRISLVREVDPGWKLNHWVKAQVTKLLCRYFDPRSAVFRKDFSNPLVFHADELFSHDSFTASPVRRASLETMLRILRLSEPAADRDIGPDWITPDLADAVFSAAVTHGVGFIVVLDGLDLLGNTRALKKRFADRLEEVAAYIGSDAPLWRHHLLFIRDESAWVVDERLREPLMRSPEQYRPINDYRVAPVDLNDLLTRRLDSLGDAEVVQRLANYSQRDVDAFRAFIDGTDSGLRGERGHPLTYAAAIKDLLGTNTRSAMHILHAAANEFVQGYTAAHYLLTDRLMRLGLPLPPPAPLYRRANDGGDHPRLERQRAGGGHAVYDATFLPSILRYPFEHGALAESELRGQGRGQLLMGLRLLQVATVLERNEMLLERLDEDSLVWYAKELFEYDAAPVRAMIEELIDEEVLQPAPHARPYSAADPAVRPLRVATKGRQIRDHYLFDPAYLYVSAFTVPSPLSFLRGRALTVVPSRPDTMTEDIVCAKIVNALVLAKLLTETSAEQQHVLEVRRRLLRPKAASLLGLAERSISALHGGMFSFVDRLREEVQLVCERIALGLDGERGRIVVDRLERLQAEFSVL